MVMGFELGEYKLLERHKKEIKSCLTALQGCSWSLDLPVFIFNRCWFRLQKIKINELSFKLSPDKSQEAPELIRYEQLINKGHDPILAVQECWHEYGMEDFHRALRKSWEWHNRGNNSWTFEKYLELITRYRTNIDNSIFSIPFIIVGRNPNDDHITEWISQSFLS